MSGEGTLHNLMKQNHSRKIMLYIPVIILFLAGVGCSIESNEKRDFFDYPYKSFNEVDFSKRFAYMDRIYTTEESSFDADSVLQIYYQGNRSYHPVQMFLISERFFHSYRLTGDKKYIEICDRQIEALLDRSKRLDDAIFFTYDFNFQLHGSEETLEKPWYSAMAQGYALTLLSRLYTATGNDNYVNIADSVLNSFMLENFEDLNRSKPWISYLDKSSNLWLSEYPTPNERPTQALNGFIFAASGLYEWYMAVKDPKAKKLLNRSLLTLNTNVEKYRKKGDVSYYCLSHKVQSEKYHSLHIKQFQFLFDITSDSTFLEYKKTFLSDFYSD